MTSTSDRKSPVVSPAALGPQESDSALDRIDLQILAVLQRDGRISKSDLSEQVNLSPSACYERMRRLEENKVILSYHANVDLRAIAQLQMFFTEVTLKTHRGDELRRFELFIEKLPEVVECFALGGGIDFILKVVARDVDQYRMLMERLLESELGIDRYSTYVATKTVKKLPAFGVENFL